MSGEPPDEKTDADAGVLASGFAFCHVREGVEHFCLSTGLCKPPLVPFLKSGQEELVSNEARGYGVEGNGSCDGGLCVSTLFG